MTIEHNMLIVIEELQKRALANPTKENKDNLKKALQAAARNNIQKTDILNAQTFGAEILIQDKTTKLQ